MFHLRFTPNFSTQRQALLSESKVPVVVLENELKHALETMNDGLQVKNLSPFQLWLLAFKSSRSLLLKSTAVATFSALCATGSTLVAMQILKNQSSVVMLVTFAGFYYLLNTLAQFGNFSNNRLRFAIGLTAETALVSAISKKLIRLSAESAMNQSSGNLKVLITSDVKSVGEFLNNLVRNLVPSLVALAIMTPLLIRFSGEAGVIGIITLTLILPVSFVLNLISTAIQHQTQQRMDELTSMAGEWVKNIRLVRFLSWEEALQKKIERQLRRFMKLAVIQHLLACLIFGLSTTWWMITAVSILYFAQQSSTPLDLTGFFGSLWLLTYIAGYFTHIPNTIRLFGLASPSMRRISKLLSEAELSDSLSPQTMPLARQAIPTHIEFESVSFKTAVEKISVEIDLSSKLAVLGEVGSGKSTFLKLLCGEIPPTEGKIWVKFSDCSRHPFWEQETYHRVRDRIAFVPQEPYVSSDLLSNNISLAEDENESAVLEAAHFAELTADLKQLPLGIRQSIGESGVNLSGGQRQRLNLARAFYANRAYLVLDDTLSAVDSKTEALLMKRLTEQKAGFILVTHRLNEIMSVGQVMVLKGGRLVELGTPDALSKDLNSAFVRALQAYDRIEEEPHV